MQTFVVNEFLSLMLDGDSTDIYINNKYFSQCKYLLISIPVKEVEDFDGYDSMDEIIKDTINLVGNSTAAPITPEEEFWGHCSNLQAWVENHYNYKVLDSKLSIPIILEIMKGLTKPADKEKFIEFFMDVIKTLDEYVTNRLHNEYLHNQLEFLKGIVCRTNNKYFSDAEISGSVILTRIYNRFIQSYLKEKEKRREYNRKKGQFNRWEAKLWGTGKKNLARRRFLRLIRSTDCSVRSGLIVSNELDYLPYLYAKGHFKHAGNISLCYLRNGTLIIRDEKGNYWKDTGTHDRGLDYGYSRW